ncbi:MAG: Glutamyl-tRNA(Gln) amidotransferase subunit A [Candidatus Anoxychlamydiales bacterium]|nr:Glutamyl-tRNA(Gln) amidotransferase subunit A [Candidatus Anoxychlamydiales bacterium]
MYRKSAIELRDLFLEKKLTAEEITTYFLNRIEKYDRELKCYINVLSKRALNTAKKLDEKLKNNERVGRLAAIPIAIKDNIHILDEITTCASQFLTNYRAPFNSTLVEILESEGAIILGKTNLDEFAMGSSCEDSSFFPTKNPWNLSCVPGGSSGGSTASVSARLTPIGFGSDTGGSVRQPSAFCSVVGYKPSYGRVSRYGLVAFGSSLDQIGPIATNAKDIGLIMEAIGKHCKKDSTSLNLPQEIYLENMLESYKNIKIGVPFHFLENLNPSIRKNFDASLEILKQNGAEIIDINLDILKYSIAVYYVIATAEASTNLARFDGIRYGKRSKNAKTLNDIYKLSREEGFGEEVKKRIMLGTYVLSSGYKNAYYTKAQKVRTLIIKAFADAFSTCDFVCTPATPNTCFEFDSIKNPIDMYRQDLFTVPANIAGIPAISIPSGFDKDNKPIAFQMFAPQLHDVRLVQAASLFEKKINLKLKIPPLFDKE